MWSTFEKGPICYIPDPERPWKKELGLNPFYRDMGLLETLSFDEYIQGHYEDEICEYITGRINDGHLKPGKGTRFIPEPDRVGCDRTYISNLRYRQKDNRVYFQATVVASLTLYARLGEMAVKDKHKEWFLVDGMWDTGDENYNMVWGEARVYQ
ncbi:MAG: hypothetical protein GX810_05935, partial [Clostridiales bacterium]|nr:hypothetical protein [Clostridiales bacterium]